MARFGVPQVIPARYVGPGKPIVPTFEAPRDPTVNDKNYSIQTIWRNKSTFDEWMLVGFENGDALWKKFTYDGVIGLRDQVNAEIEPNNDGFIDVDGAAVDNGTNPSSIPLETVKSGNTLLIQSQVSAAIGSAPGDKNDAGICSFDSSSFSVDSDGFVSLAGSGGGPATLTVTGDAGGAVGPDGTGTINAQGVAVANAANAKPVFVQGTPGSNLIEVDVQVGSAITGAPADSNDAGLVSFDDTQFGVDSNGYVTMAGAAGLPPAQTLTGDGGGAVGPDGSGNIDIQGVTVANATNGQPLFVQGTPGSNLLEADIQVAAAITGAPADSNDAGICSFDDTQFTVDSNGYVELATGLNNYTLITSGTLSGTEVIDTSGNWNYDSIYIYVDNVYRTGSGTSPSLDIKFTDDGGSTFISANDNIRINLDTVSDPKYFSVYSEGCQIAANKLFIAYGRRIVGATGATSLRGVSESEGQIDGVRFACLGGPDFSGDYFVWGR